MGSAVRGLKQIQTSDLLRTEEHHFIHLIREEKLHSMLATPLVYENEAIGVLALYVDKPYRFNDDERLLARALADLGAIAIENARLYGRVFDTEESLRKSERLTTLGMLAAEIAPEIRKPLMVLRLLFDSIKSGATSDEETEKDLEVIREKLNHLEQIAGRILDFGKDREPIRPELSISELLDAVVRLVRRRLARAKAGVGWVDSPMDRVVMPDQGQAL